MTVFRDDIQLEEQLKALVSKPRLDASMWVAKAARSIIIVSELY